jgi:hypothetical protein
MGSITARLPFSKITNITYSGGLLSGTVVVTASNEKKPYEFASFSTTHKVFSLVVKMIVLIFLGR